MPARSEPAVVYSEACIHNGVDIVINRGLGDLIRLVIGAGEELVLEFIEPESLERLAAIATEAAAEFRERIAADNGEIA